MHHLENTELRLDILDPIVDAARLATRYCCGGYVWQVHDLQIGTLLAGPSWPNPEPDPFDGQGLPESFRHRTRDGIPLTWDGDNGLAIGIGTLAIGLHNQVNVVSPCGWKITAAVDRITFETRQAGAGFSYELTRELRLDQRTVASANSLRNAGSLPLSLQWFAHPFFPLNHGTLRVELPTGTKLPSNPGFSLNEAVLNFSRRFRDKDDGQFSLLNLPPTRALKATLDHPTLSEIEMNTSFAPDECPIWANANTFSIEPYLTINLAPGETKNWHLRYRFGQARPFTR
jgi:hypothetical protein